jgi:hypothetical protein
LGLGDLVNKFKLLIILLPLLSLFVLECAPDRRADPPAEPNLGVFDPANESGSWVFDARTAGVELFRNKSILNCRIYNKGPGETFSDEFSKEKEQFGNEVYFITHELQNGKPDLTWFCRSSLPLECLIVLYTEETRDECLKAVEQLLIAYESRPK